MMTPGTTLNPATAALAWIERGFLPVPIPFREKRPVLEQWEQLRIGKPDVARYFNGAPQNIGVLLGEPYGAADLDLDCPEAIAAAATMAPPTGMIFGHTSKPASHRFYRSDPPMPSKKYLDPTDTTCLCELRCTKLDGSTGLQTVAPPSTHKETGELIRFEPGFDREPANIDGAELAAAVARIAAAALLARHWPAAGHGRHECELALAGCLTRAGWQHDDAERFVLATYRAVPTHDRTKLDRVRESVRSSFAKRGGDNPTTGFTTLAAAVGDVVARCATRWLGITAETGRATASQPGAPIQHDGNGEPEPRATDRGIVVELSDRIRATDHFAQDAGRRLQRFRGGVYVFDGEEHVRRRALALLREWRSEKRFSRNLCAEVAEHIRIQAPALWDRPPMETLNCANGLLDLKSRELRPHDPAHLSAVQIPVSFDPTAECDAWQEFIEATFPADAAALAFEILGWLMVPYMSLQKAVLALGGGENGKSIFLSAVTAFIGRSNCAAMSLHSLESDRFAAARLMGKLVNVCPDLPSAYLESTSVFKAVVGGDRIPAEYKFHDGFDFEPFARLLFSANHPPKSGDSSEGFFRRWVVIPFDKTFSPDRAGYIRRDILLSRLAAPAELSGVLNRALDTLPRILTRGFSDPESIRQAAKDFRAATDHFSVWLDLATVDHPAAWVPMAMLAAAYNLACEQAGRPPMSKQQFGRALRQARPEVRDSRRMTEGRQILGYQGIGLRQESEAIQ